MRLFLPLLFLLAITGPAHSDQPVIRWYGFDWAPGYITEGPLKGQGFADEMQAIVQENLPGFTHENLWVSLPRADRAIRIEDNACFTPGFHEWRDHCRQDPKGYHLVRATVPVLLARSCRAA